MDLVGYSPNGYKMELLRKTYVNEDKWKEFRKVVRSTNKGFSAQGMNFNMSIEKKGGCLSSLHLIRNREKNILVIHGKIAEIPRKFVADLLLVRDLLQELNLWPIEVRFMYSTIYYSIVGLRAYIPVLGKDHMDFHNLPIDTPRNYQAGIIEAINKVGERFTPKERREGIWTKINQETGEWIE
jgi:hypothetical protein